MFASGFKGAQVAMAVCTAGAVVLIAIDQLWLLTEIDQSIDLFWLGALAFLLLSGAAVVVSLPFSAVGGFVLGCLVEKRDMKMSVAIVLGIMFGIVAVLGAFSVVFYWQVCAVSHGLCREDLFGWIQRFIQREFLEGAVYPRRLALSVLIAAMSGGWVAQRLWLSVRQGQRAHASA